MRLLDEAKIPYEIVEYDVGLEGLEVMGMAAEASA